MGRLKTLNTNYLLLFSLIFLASALLFLKSRIIGDPFSYYAWVRSAFFDHNFNFLNEYTLYNVDKSWTAIAWPKDLAYTKIGLLNNPFSIGPAILWLPFVIIAFLFTSATNFLFNLFRIPLLANDGYSFYYHFFVSFGNYFLGFVGIFLIYLILTKYFSKKISLLATLTIIFATSVFNYLYNEPTSSHITSIFIISLFFFFFLNLKKDRFSHWLFLGIIGGFVFLVRWQQIVFLLPALWSLLKTRKISYFLGFATGFLPTFSIQLLAWYFISGSLFFIPQGTGFVSLTAFLSGYPPQFLKVLFSANHGLFYWTPITFFALLGLIFLSFRGLTIARWGLLIFILSLMVNSNLADPFGGYSFSGRRFIEDTLFLTIGLAGFLQLIKSNLARVSFALVFSVWNIFLVLQYASSKIPGWGSLVFPDWIKSQLNAPLYLPNFIGHSVVASNLYYFAKGKGGFFIVFGLIIILIHLTGSLIFYKIGEKSIKFNK